MKAEVIVGDSSTWSISGKSLVSYGGKGEQWILFGDKSWKDYEYSFEFMSVRENVSLNMLFRSPSDQKVVHWGAGWRGHAVLQYRKNDDYFLNLVAKRLSFNKPNQWHSIKTVVRGKSIKCYFDPVSYTHLRAHETLR